MAAESCGATSGEEGVIVEERDVTLSLWAGSSEAGGDAGCARGEDTDSLGHRWPGEDAGDEALPRCGDSAALVMIIAQISLPFCVNRYSTHTSSYCVESAGGADDVSASRAKGDEAGDYLWLSRESL